MPQRRFPHCSVEEKPRRRGAVPLGVKLYANGFRSEKAAKLPAKKLCASFLDGIAREQSGHPNYRPGPRSAAAKLLTKGEARRIFCKPLI